MNMCNVACTVHIDEATEKCPLTSVDRCTETLRLWFILADYIWHFFFLKWKFSWLTHGTLCANKQRESILQREKQLLLRMDLHPSRH